MELRSVSTIIDSRLLIVFHFLIPIKISFMAENPLHYPIVLFDWGDTVMYDDPASTVPMVEWTEVRAVEGIADVLADLHASGRQHHPGHRRMVSDEGQIRGALARAGSRYIFFPHLLFQEHAPAERGGVLSSHSGRLECPRFGCADGR